MLTIDHNTLTERVDHLDLTQYGPSGRVPVLGAGSPSRVFQVYADGKAALMVTEDPEERGSWDLEATCGRWPAQGRRNLRLEGFSAETAVTYARFWVACSILQPEGLTP